MTNNQKLEIEARAFEIITGRMAPFKDSPAAAGLTDHAERAEVWREWRQFYGIVIEAMEKAFEELEEKP